MFVKYKFTKNDKFTVRDGTGSPRAPRKYNGKMKIRLLWIEENVTLKP